MYRMCFFDDVPGHTAKTWSFRNISAVADPFRFPDDVDIWLSVSKWWGKWGGEELHFCVSWKSWKLCGSLHLPEVLHLFYWWSCSSEFLPQWTLLGRWEKVLFPFYQQWKPSRQKNHPTQKLSHSQKISSLKAFALWYAKNFLTALWKSLLQGKLPDDYLYLLREKLALYSLVI